MESEMAFSSSGSGERLRKRVLAPECGGLWVEGSSGIGKTTLLFETYGKLKETPGVLIGAARFSSGAEPPVLPVLSALGELLGDGLAQAHMSLEQLVERLPAELSRLARAMGRIMFALGAGQGAGEPGSRWRLREVVESYELLVKTWRDNPRLCEQILCRLMVLSSREFNQRIGKTSQVLMLDQLERAGRQSRRVVEALGQLPRGLLTLVVSWNAGDNGLDSLPAPTPHGFDRITLLPWSPESLKERYQSLGGRRPLTAHQLFEATGGSPLALRVLLWSEQHRGSEALQLTAGRALRPVLDQLPLPARELLGLLALLPAPLQLGKASLAPLLNLEPTQVEPVLRGLVEQGLIGTYPRQLLLSHALIREAVLEALPSELTIPLAQRLVRLIETQHSRDMVWGCLSPFLTGFHQALELMEDSRALKVCLELCDSWISYGEWDVASVYADRLGELAGSLSDAERARYLSVRGRIAYERQAYPQAQQLFHEAMEAFLAARDVVGGLQARLSRAAALQAAGDLGAAQSVLEQWLADGRREAEAYGWEVWQRLAQLCALQGDSAGATNALRQAVSASQGVSSVRAQVKLLRELAELHLTTGHLDTGISWLQQALERTRQLNDRALVAEISVRLATVWELADNPAQAEALWQKALEEVADDGPHEALWCTISAGLGAFLQRQGRAEEALDCQLKALDLAREVGMAQTEALLLGEAALTYDVLGNARLALDFAARALALKRQQGELRAIAVGCNTLGTLQFAADNLESARALLLESLQHWQTLEETSAEALAHNNLGMVLERQGEQESSRQHFEQALALRAELDEPHALRYTLTNLVVFQESMRYLAGAETSMRQLIELDRQLQHGELHLEERYLESMRRRMRTHAVSSAR